MAKKKSVAKNSTDRIADSYWIMKKAIRKCSSDAFPPVRSFELIIANNTKAIVAK